MKRTLNTIFHGAGYLLICLGFLMCLGAAGNSDLGMDMASVGRYGLSGLATALTGLFLIWWKV